MAVSVIIPCYNQANFLAEAIESALVQSVPPSEVIVVDDGSTDHTPEVAKSYPVVQYLRQENKGLCEARNVGFQLSGGDFLIFLDSDDRLPSGTIGAGLLALRGAPDAGFAFGRLRRIAIDGTTIGERKEPERTDYYHDLLEDNYIPTPGMVLFRRTALDLNGLFDPRIPATADYDLYLRIARKTAIVSHPVMTVERRVHPQAMTRNAANMLRSVLVVHRRQWRHARKDKALLEAYRQGRNWWKEWYGNQLLTQMKVEIRLREWSKFSRNLWTMTRFHPSLLSQLLVKARQSSRLTFTISSDPRAVCLEVIDHDSFDNQSEDNKQHLRIAGIELKSAYDLRDLRVLPENVLLATIFCENAKIGTRAILDGNSLPSVTLANSEVQAFFPMDMLQSSKLHELCLLG